MFSFDKINFHSRQQTETSNRSSFFLFFSFLVLLWLDIKLCKNLLAGKRHGMLDVVLNATGTVFAGLEKSFYKVLVHRSTVLRSTFISKEDYVET